MRLIIDDGMQAKQPYTEVPYRPADEDPAPGSPGGLHSSAHEAAIDPLSSATSGHAVDSKESVSSPWRRGAGMVKRIIISLVVLAIVGYFGWWAYKNWRSGQASATGEVFSREPIAASVTRSGEISTPSVQSPGNSNSKNTFALPASDSQAPNAPEGQRFTGSGKFQVYRQGNITYRVNTETGESCVLFATPDEWRKAVVYNHSCHTS